jgi:hypothetical protein
MDDTACAAADAAAAPEIDDPLAAAAPNPAYLAALAGALDLAQEARVPDLARAIANPRREDLVSALLCHELASCHRLMMRFGAMADHFLSHASPTVDAEQRQVGRDAIGFAAIAARLMARYRQGALALPKLRADVDAAVKKIIVDWGDDYEGGGNGSGNDNDPNPADPVGDPVGAPGAATASPLRRACAPERASTPDTAPASARRRGRLKNGNPSGDYLAAPRCGAKTRAGCACRQPAMKNGRCRLHGGKSTGARTAEGRSRACTARLVHGRRTAAVIGLRSAAAAVTHRLAWMTDLARELSAGHGLDCSDPTPPLDDAGINRRATEAPRCHARGASGAQTTTSNPGREPSSRYQSSPAGIARPDIPNSASRRLSASVVDLSSLPPLGKASIARFWHPRWTARRSWLNPMLAAGPTRPGGAGLASCLARTEESAHAPHDAVRSLRRNPGRPWREACLRHRRLGLHGRARPVPAGRHPLHLGGA